MTTISIVDGLKYGFKFLGLSLALVLLSGAFLAGGAALAGTGLDAQAPMESDATSVAAGALLTLVGVLGLYGGTFGLLHKFIADSVGAGVVAARTEADRPPATTGTADTADDTATEQQSSATAGPETAAAAGATAAADESGAPEAQASVQQPQPSTGGTVAGQAQSGTAATAPEAGSGGEPTASQVGTEDERQNADDGANSQAVDRPDAGAADRPDAEGVPDDPSGEVLDKVVSEATDPGREQPEGPAEAPPTQPEPVDDARNRADQFEPAAEEGGVPADDGVEDEVAEPTYDADFEGEEGTSDGTDHPMGGGGDPDIEDTTDEPGDWEPLDEDDL